MVKVSLQNIPVTVQKVFEVSQHLLSSFIVQAEQSYEQQSIITDCMKLSNCHISTGQLTQCLL